MHVHVHVTKNFADDIKYLYLMIGLLFSIKKCYIEEVNLCDKILMDAIQLRIRVVQESPWTTLNIESFPLIDSVFT